MTTGHLCIFCFFNSLSVVLMELSEGDQKEMRQSVMWAQRKSQEGKKMKKKQISL